jgi:hypothetical protein
MAPKMKRRGGTPAASALRLSAIVITAYTEEEGEDVPCSKRIGGGSIREGE